MTMTTARPTTDDEAVDALQAFAVLPGWLSALMEPGRLEQALRRSVPELRDGRLALVGCRPDRLRAKGQDWLARCSVTVADGSGEDRDVVLVGSLLLPTERALGNVPGTHESGFGSPGWEGYLEDLGLRVRVQETDEGLPALESLLDPEAAAATIERCLQAGPRPEARVTSCVPRVARYKPGSRCTVVYRVQYADSPADDHLPGPVLPDPVVAKTHQGDKGLAAHEAMTALWDSPLADGGQVLLAEPLGYLPDERVLLQGPVPEERTLKELAREAFTEQDPARLAELRSELEKTAAALAALHRSGARYSRTATWHAEVEEVRTVLDRLSLSAPGLRAAAEPLLGRLEELDRAVPADPLVSAHHDFRPAQVLLHSGRVGFIDFDGAAMAEPGLDLGRFRCKLRDTGISALSASAQELRGPKLEERLALLDDLCEHFLASYQAHAPVSRERVLLWETVDLLTALLHTWTKVRLLRVGPRLAVLVHQVRTAHPVASSAHVSQ